MADHDFVKITRRSDGFFDFEVKGKFSAGTLEEIQRIVEILKEEAEKEVKKWLE